MPKLGQKRFHLLQRITISRVMIHDYHQTKPCIQHSVLCNKQISLTTNKFLLQVQHNQGTETKQNNRAKSTDLEISPTERLITIIQAIRFRILTNYD